MLYQSIFTDIYVKIILKNFTKLLQDMVHKKREERYIVYTRKMADFQGKIAIAFLIGSDYNGFSTSVLGYIFYEKSTLRTAEKDVRGR